MYKNMDVQNIVLQCVRIFSLRNKPVETFIDLANVELLASLVQLINNREEYGSNIGVISSEIKSLFKEHFSSSNLADIDAALNGNDVELCILYLLLIFISLLTNANLRSKFLSSSMSLSTESELKLTYLMERLQEKSAISHTNLEILVQKNLDFVVDGTFQTNGVASPPHQSTCAIKYQSPLTNYLQSPSFKSQRKVDEKNREIKNLRQQVYNLEGEKQDLQDENAALARMKEKIERERHSISEEYKSLMKEYEESSNSALQDEKEDKKLVVHCQKKIKILESDNKSLSIECSRISEEYNELFEKLETARNEVNSLSIENHSLVESNKTLQQACSTNETLLEEQSSELTDIKNQLEELKRYFQEQKSFCKTIDESFDFSSSQNSSQATIGANNQSIGMVEDNCLQLKGMQMDLSANNKIIADLTAECQRLTSQLTVTELELREKEKCCNSFMIRIEHLSSQLEASRKVITANEQEAVEHNNDANKCENNEILSKNKYLLKEIKNLQDKNYTLQTKLRQVEEVKETMNQKVERIHNLNIEHAEKYEKILEENRSLLETIISVKDEKEHIQIMLNVLKEEKYSSTNEHTSFEEKLTTISNEKDRLEKEFENMHEKVGKKDSLLQSLQDKISLLKEENTRLSKEVEGCQQKLISYKDGSADTRTEILSAKEDAFKIERDLQKTIDSLTASLQSSNDKNSKNERTIERMKAKFNSEMQNVLDQVAELEGIRKDNDILKTKYESSKKVVLNCRAQQEQATSNSKRIELELNEVKSELLSYKKDKRQLSLKLQNIEEERQPLKSELVELENKLKRVVTEKNSITAQLQMAETSLRELKKGQKRSSFMQSGNGNLRSCEQRHQANSDELRTNVGFRKENQIMIAPPPPGRKSLRLTSTSQTGLKKTASEANFSVGHQSKEALLVRTKSVATRPATRLSNCDFNVQNAIPQAASVASDDDVDAEFVDARSLVIDNDLDASLDWRRMSELQRRNSLYPPHMRSDYTAEMQYKLNPFSEDNFRAGDVEPLPNTLARTYNLRKRSFECSATPSDRKTRRLTEAYSRTQRPSNEVRKIPLENDAKNKPSTSKTSQKLLRETRHGLSPANRVHRTPSSLSHILRSGKSPWKRFQDKKEDGQSSSEASRKKIFRNPFGSKNYNVQSASLKNEAPTS